MERFTNLPDDAREELKTDISNTQANELLTAEVAEFILSQERPIWSSSAIMKKLDGDWSRAVVKDKLKDLEERGFCNSLEAGTGRIYWWDHDETDWPRPPDVTLEADPSLSVSDALEPHYVQLGIVALAFPTVASIPVFLGVFSLGGSLTLPISGESLLSLGLLTIILCYMLLVYSVIVGAIDYATPESLTTDVYELFGS
ncbi:hypothetical protein GOC83_04030 [Haloarcula rubripromontorii]|uniref:Uncharacterized protein n=1 Tax=Haloarcula rubripromontorii TaxID=1705562 RepID=A0A847U362_9EURY|nr:hypothetical protein [Haloarcula rubripromontorii]NLV05301.1 hypothetical protein [Haloarcula rubripromontorii]